MELKTVLLSFDERILQIQVAAIADIFLTSGGTFYTFLNYLIWQKKIAAKNTVSEIWHWYQKVQIFKCCSKIAYPMPDAKVEWKVPEHKLKWLSTISPKGILLLREKRMNLFDFNKRFHDEQECHNHFKELRSQLGIVCKKCGSTDHYWKQDRD